MEVEGTGRRGEVSQPPGTAAAEGDRTGSQGDIFSGGAETGKAGGGARGRPGLSEHLQRAWGGGGADAGLPAGSAEEIPRAQERPSLGGLDGVGGTGGRQAPSRHLIIHRNSHRSGILGVSGRASAWPGPERRGQESGKEGQYTADGVTRGRAGGRGWRAPEGLSQQGGCSGPGLRTQHSRTRYCGPGAGAERAHSGLVHAVCPNRSAPGSGMARQDSTRGVKGMGQSQTRQGRRGRVSAISGEGGRGAGRARPGYRWRAARYRPPEPTAKAGLMGSDRGATGASHARTGGEARSPAGVDGPVSLKGQDVSAMNLLERYDMVRCDGEGR
ncbi:collagen alpha-2(I) chain-like [Dipodomys spectabilis]|uniref:collagen alpha-2(I) chain-like n=1 Tax=Dipodomys spectabilis TaxID=105255 RepID=UPI001C539DB5|nr:collagen alpha-2(I) chain-like [Dipodomys spectabilis]